MKTPKVTHWRGKLIDSYTKKELIEIVEELGRLYTNELERNLTNARGLK